MGCSHLMWHFFHVASTWKSSLRDSISNPKIIIINDLKCKNSKKRERKEEKEKEKKKKWRCARRSNHTRSRPPRDPGRRARPRLPRATCVLSLQPLFLGFFFFFSSLMNTYSSLMNEYFQELLLLLSLWFFLLLSLLWFSLCCF